MEITCTDCIFKFAYRLVDDPIGYIGLVELIDEIGIMVVIQKIIILYLNQQLLLDSFQTFFCFD